MNGQTKSSNTDSPNSEKPNANFNGTSTKETEEETAEALMPVPIGGAYLICAPLAEGAECRAFDYQNKSYDMQANRAYILRGSPVSWVSIEFVRTDVGTWTVQVPASEKSYGVAFLDANDQQLADWIVKTDSAPENLALDGSFESLDVGGEDYLPIVPSVDYAWKVSKPSSPDIVNRCSIAMLEVQTIVSGMPPIDGNQWIELNADCLDPGVGHPENFNVTVSQKFKVEPGHSYEIIFSYRSRAEGDFLIAFGGSNLATVHSADTSWQELRYLKKVDGAEAEISITGNNNSNGGGGTLIDNIRVYDLGAGPQK